MKGSRGQRKYAKKKRNAKKQYRRRK